MQDLTKRYGPEIAQSIAKRIGELLKNKIGAKQPLEGEFISLFDVPRF